MTDTQPHLKVPLSVYPTISSMTIGGMMEKVKFTYINRIICPKTGIHFLDAVDEDGQLWSAEMRTDVERWIIYSSPWKKSGQVPYKTLEKPAQGITQHPRDGL